MAKVLLGKIQAILEDKRSEIVRAGIRVAIFGPPNAGKSSLLNFLGGRALFGFTLILTLSLLSKERCRHCNFSARYHS